MLDKRYYYDKAVAICEEDLTYLRELKVEKFGRKSVAGVLSLIIKHYKDNPTDLDDKKLDKNIDNFGCRLVAKMTTKETYKAKDFKTSDFLK